MHLSERERCRMSFNLIRSRPESMVGSVGPKGASSILVAPPITRAARTNPLLNSVRPEMVDFGSGRSAFFYRRRSRRRLSDAQSGYVEDLKSAGALKLGSDRCYLGPVHKRHLSAPAGVLALWKSSTEPDCASLKRRRLHRRYKKHCSMNQNRPFLDGHYLVADSFEPLWWAAEPQVWMEPL